MGACRTCLIFITIQLVSFATAQEMEKRVPQGFLGMRGKKDVDDESTEQFYKRRPQFFVGVKGKKSLQDVLESAEEVKRAPMGFMGMRGKKELFVPDYQNSEFVPKRDGSLLGMIDYTSNPSDKYQDAYPVLNDILMEFMDKIEQNRNTEADNYLEPSSIMNEIQKRAANVHQFFGVRGKKSVDNKRPYDLSFRGKFIGVRGKKDFRNTNMHQIKFLLDNPLPKRKSQMGFFGMRGKKWADVNDWSQEPDESN